MLTKEKMEGVEVRVGDEVRYAYNMTPAQVMEKIEAAFGVEQDKPKSRRPRRTKAEIEAAKKAEHLAETTLAPSDVLTEEPKKKRGKVWA